MQRYCTVVKYIPHDVPKDTRHPKFEYEKVIFKKRVGIVNRCEARIKAKGTMAAIYLIDLKSKEQGGPRVERIWGNDIEFDLIAGSILRAQLQGKSKRQVEKQIESKSRPVKPRIKMKHPEPVKVEIKKDEKPVWKPPYVIKRAGVDAYEAPVEEEIEN